MKNKTPILSSLLLLAALFIGCTQEEDNLFEKSPAARMTEYLAGTDKILQGPEQGWLMYYFPDGQRKYGGFSYTVKFDGSKAEVGFQGATDVSKTLSSLYRLTNDTGPVLSFDTNNEYLHFFATPSASRYQGLQGDFEFMLLEVAPDHVKMMGRRSGNLITMVPLKQASADYLNGVNALADDFIISGIKGTVGPTQVTAKLNLDYQQVTFELGEESAQAAYLYTPTGIRLYEPVKIGDAGVQNFDFDPKTLKLTCTDPNVKGDLVGTLPDGYRRIESYPGDYWLIYDKEDENDTEVDSLAVSLVENEPGHSLKMTGLNPKYAPVFAFDKTNGVLTWSYQILGTMDDGSTVRLCALDGKSGYFTWADSVFGRTEWNGDEQQPCYRIIPEYRWSGTRYSNSFYLCTWDANGIRKKAPTAASGWRFIIGDRTVTSIRHIWGLAKR